MAVKFKLRIKYSGASQIESYTGTDGKVVTEKITGTIENEVYDAAGKMITKSVEDATERNLFLAAIFFQRVVSRTPMDEDYMTGVNDELKPVMHIADDDYVRDAWIASYGRKSISAKSLRENYGCEFIKFNNRNEVKIIYEQFKNLIGNRKNITRIRIANEHERFPLLEYGEYKNDGSIKSGKNFKHGVKNGYSIQAPVGMLRLTQAEFEESAFNIPTEDLMKSGKNWQRGLKKQGSLDNVKKVLKGKTKVSFKEACEIARLYR